MKLLLDTCTFLWIVSGSEKFSGLARAAFLDSENERFLSVSSAWEMAIKYSLGRLPLPERPEVWVPRIREESGIEALPIDEESALHSSRLPLLHGDPFDRILVAQAIVHGMTILTPDEEIAKYAVRVLW